MNVKRSCHLAFLGRRVFEPMYATRPETAATAHREPAEAVVNNCGFVGVVSITNDKCQGLCFRPQMANPHDRLTCVFQNGKLVHDCPSESLEASSFKFHTCKHAFLLLHRHKSHHRARRTSSNIHHLSRMICIFILP